MFRFADIQWLAALTAVPIALVLFILASRRRRRALEAFADHALVRRLTATVSAASRRWKAALVLASFALLAVALARPQFGTRVETVRSTGQDIVVAVDLSTSMLAEDVSPNRLERARLAILRLIGNLDGDRIALVAFAVGTLQSGLIRAAWWITPLTALLGSALGIVLFAVIGAVLSCLACLTPLAVLALGAIGLSAWAGSADVILLPLLVACIGLAVYRHRVTYRRTP